MAMTDEEASRKRAEVIAQRKKDGKKETVSDILNSGECEYLGGGLVKKKKRRE